MLKKFLILFAVFLMLFIPTAFSATKEDVISAISATYKVGNDSFRLPQSVINKGINFLNKKKLSSEQYDKILGTIGSAVSIAQEAGTTDITKIKKEDLRRGLGLVQQAAKAANVDLSEVTSQLSSGLKNADNSNNSQDVSGKQDATSIKIEERQKKIISGDSTVVVDKSGEVVKIYSGDEIDSGDSVSNVDLDSLMSLAKDNTDSIKNIVDKNVTFIIIGIVVLLVVLLIIIVLVARAKINKVLKAILMIFLIVLFVATLFALVVGLYYLVEIKMVYELYYLFS